MSKFNKEILSPILTNIGKFSERNAFCINDTFYTYSDFGNSISKIRKALCDRGKDSPIVGLVINDDLETYSSIIALWLEGKCYVPLHPKWPLERCLDICGQVELDLILDSSDKTRYEDFQVIETSLLEYTEERLTPKQNISDDELAYILFTSGSTGKPKGVQIMRKNVAAFMDSFWKTGIQINKEDRCLQCFDLTFDVSVQGYLVALTRGGCLYTVPYGQMKYLYVIGLMEEHKLTFAAMAPSMLRYMKPYFGETDMSCLMTCILTAEACPLDLMEDLYHQAPNVNIYDFYGPTEGTVYATYYKLERDRENKTLNGIISIGKPLVNVKAIIMDENGKLLPQGEEGELCITGPQITSGYWNNAEKNASSFFMKEVDGAECRFYRTGDLCYMDGDGDIMYSGRLDHQVKIQGFRVELGEIEFHARTFLKDKNAVCVAFNNRLGVSEIAMFIESDPFDLTELTAYMRSIMPAYMVPSHIVFVKRFPLNSNDKVDKNKLKSLIIK